jgi:hypothetical protein
MQDEWEQFGRGRSPEKYKLEELAAVDDLKDDSDEELERKRLWSTSHSC